MVVVGPLVVVALVVVGLVLRVWPLDPLWVFRSPFWARGVGHRAQPLGLYYVVGRGGGSGAGLVGDGGRGVVSCRPGGLEEKLAVFCCRGKDFADELAYLVDLLVSGGKGVC